MSESNHYRNSQTVDSFAFTSILSFFVMNDTNFLPSRPPNLRPLRWKSRKSSLIIFAKLIVSFTHPRIKCILHMISVQKMVFMYVDIFYSRVTWPNRKSGNTFIYCVPTQSLARTHQTSFTISSFCTWTHVKLFLYFATCHTRTYSSVQFAQNSPENRNVALTHEAYHLIQTNESLTNNCALYATISLLYTLNVVSEHMQCTDYCCDTCLQTHKFDASPLFRRSLWLCRLMCGKWKWHRHTTLTLYHCSKLLIWVIVTLWSYVHMFRSSVLSIHFPLLLGIFFVILIEFIGRSHGDTVWFMIRCQKC